MQKLAYKAKLNCALRNIQNDEMQKRVHSWLLQHGEQTSAAAGIAGLLGNYDAAHVQRVAVSLFRYVSADKVTKEDMANNKPDPALRAKTLSALLGGIDAFLTHSWHDDPEEKWRILQRWREAFLRQRMSESQRSGLTSFASM